MKTFRAECGSVHGEAVLQDGGLRENLPRRVGTARPVSIRAGSCSDRSLRGETIQHPAVLRRPARGLLGFTLFGPKGVEEIVVSKALDEESTQIAERRLRTTLAHESGHGLLHAHLFAFGTPPDSLFGDALDARTPKILCRIGDISGSETPRMQKQKPPYRWWEYQANQAIGALLLPKSLVQPALASILRPQGVLGMPVLPANLRPAAIRLLADTFNVNPVVAKLRLEALFPLAAEGQLTL